MRRSRFFCISRRNNIHQPRWPHPRFSGASGCGRRCDAIQEFDDSVGQVLAALGRLKLADNTLLIITSDNGPAMDDGYLSYDVRDANGHRPGGPLRGFKGSMFEGGTREPFLARWPGRIKPGSQSGELLSLVDMLATCAAVADQRLPDGAGPDSFNLLPLLLGQRPKKPLRDHLVMQGGNPRNLAIRKGPWKLAGGELFNLEADLGEQTNVAAQHPEIVQELSGLLAGIRSRGRSR